MSLGKSLFLVLYAKLYLDGDIIFMILLRKIMKMMSPSKESFAAAGGEMLFTQPPTPPNINFQVLARHFAEYFLSTLASRSLKVQTTQYT